MSKKSLIVQIRIGRQWQDYADVTNNYTSELRQQFLKKLKKSFKARLIERIFHVEELVLES